MKKWILACVMISALGLSACSSNNSNNAVMTSDAGNITQNDLYQAMKTKYGVQTLQELAVEKVLSKKYTVTQAQVDAQVQQTKNQLGSQFLSTLQQYGFQDENDYANMVKINLLEQQAVYSTINVTNKELEDAYAAYKPDIHARHILVADLKTANEIEAKLKKGANFADLAKQYSTDTGSASKGGDLGWFGTGVMDPTFEKAAFALKVNQISAPVHTQYGYHIIQVLGIKPKPSFASLKSTLTNQIKQSKVTPTMIQNVLQNLFKQEHVTITDKALTQATNFSATPGNASTTGQ